MINWRWFLDHPVLAILVWTYVFYLLFLIYAAWKAAKDAGRAVPLLATILIGAVVLFGYLVDVIYNAIVGSVIFLEAPWVESWKVWTWTFTARLKRHKPYTDWRGREARFWAGLLDPFEQGGHV